MLIFFTQKKDIFFTSNIIILIHVYVYRQRFCIFTVVALSIGASRTHA